MINHTFRLKKRLKQYGGHCADRKCGKTGILTIDHIIPQQLLAMLGFPDAYKTDEDNLQILCKEHNQLKGNLLDYTNPKTLPLLKKYVNMWIEKHADYFIGPALRQRKLVARCQCGVKHETEVDEDDW